MSRTLVTICFVVNGLPESRLSEFVSSLDVSIGRAINESLSPTSRAVADAHMEWYGAAVLPERSLSETGDIL